MNDEENSIHKMFAPFLSSNFHEHNMIQQKEEFVVWKNAILDLLLNKPKSFYWQVQ